MEEPKQPKITVREGSPSAPDELEDRIAELIAEALHNLITRKGQNTAKIDKNI